MCKVSHGEFPDARLDQIAGELRSIAHSSSWTRTLAAGEVVLRNFFGGSVEEWRTHRRQKDESIRRLARRADCPLGKSALSEAVGIYVVCEELPASVSQLTPSHVATVLGLSPIKRAALLEHALAARLSVRELKAEVLLLKRRHGERRGRPRFSQARAALSLVTKSATALESARALLEQASEIDRSTQHQLELALRGIDRASRFVRERAETLGGGPNVRSTAMESVLAPKLDEQKLVG